MDFVHCFSRIGKLFMQFIKSEKALESPKKTQVGRPKHQISKVLFGIFYIFREGLPWRKLPARYGGRSTVHRYFQDWCRKRIFLKFWIYLVRLAKKDQQIAASLSIIDGTSIFNRGLPRTVAFVSAQYRPKRTIRLSVLVDKKGVPLSVQTGKANEHDTNLLESTLKSEPKNSKKFLKKFLLGDKGYIGKRQEKTSKAFGYTGIFQKKRNQLKPLISKEKRILNKNRWKVERSISWLKNFSRVRNCFDKTLDSFLGWVHLACIVVLLRNTRIGI